MPLDTATPPAPLPGATPATAAVPTSQTPVAPAPAPAPSVDAQPQNTNATTTPAPGANAGVPAPTLMDHANAVLDDLKTFAGNAPSEIAKAFVEGTRNALQQGATTLDDAVSYGAKHGVGFPAQPLPPQDVQDSTEKVLPEPHLPAVEGPETGTGKFLSQAFQFTEGMAALGVVLGPIGDAGPIARVGSMLVRSAADAAVFFDPYKARLSNLIQSYPSLANPVAKFLQADPKDPEVVARLKNGLETAGLGVALDSTLQGVVAVSHYLKGDVPAAVDAAKSAEEAATAGKAAAPTTPAAASTTGQPGDLTGGIDATGKGATPLIGPGEVPKPYQAPAPTFSQDEIRSTADSLMEAYGGSKGDPFHISQPLDVSPINLGYVTNPNARTALLTELGARLGQAREARGDIDLAGNNAATLSNGKMLASAMGANPDEALNWASNVVKNVQDAIDYVPALKIVTASMEAQFRQHAQWHLEGRLGPYSTPEEFNSNVDALAQGLMQYGETSQRLGTAGGQLLQAHQITTGQNSGIASAIKNYNLGGDPDAARDLMLRRVATANPNDPDALGQIVRPWFTGAQRFASYYVNSLLGYSTATVKATSDFIKGGIVQPTEQAYKGIYRGLTTNDWTQFTQAGAQVNELLHGILGVSSFGGRSAWYFAKKAFTSGKQIIDPTHGAGFVPADMSGGSVESLGLLSALERGDYTYATSAALAKTLQLPVRLINTIHEFSQQVIYRSRVYGKASTEAALQGLSGADRDQFISSAMQRSFGPNGEALDPEALEYARGGTYSTQLDPNHANPIISVGGHVQDFINKHPLGRIVLPFVKAPANLLYDVYQYTPGVKTAIDLYKAAQAGGGQVAEDAVGRLLTGASLWAGALGLAFSGHLTDGGSQDTNARREQMQTGWLPHSLVLRDPDGTAHYYPVDRIDPFGSILSMAADAHTIMGQANEADRNHLAAQMAVAVSRDILSKNYLRNFADFVDALGASNTDQTADQKWTSLLNSMAGGLVPSQLARANDDPMMRETRGVIAAMLNRIPGMSQTLDRRFNTLGEPYTREPSLGPDLVSPFYYGLDMGDPVQNMLSHVANSNPHGFKPPPRTMRLPGGLKTTPGVDLTTIPAANGHSAYDYYQQLIGDFGDGSPTLRDEITTLVKNNPKFWLNPDPDGTHDIGGVRYMELNKIISERRQAAAARLIRGNSELRNALIADQKDGLAVLRGGGNAQLPPPVRGQRQRP